MLKFYFIIFDFYFRFFYNFFEFEVFEVFVQELEGFFLFFLWDNGNYFDVYVENVEYFFKRDVVFIDQFEDFFNRWYFNGEVEGSKVFEVEKVFFCYVC